MGKMLIERGSYILVLAFLVALNLCPAMAAARESKDGRPPFPNEMTCPTPLEKNAPGPWSPQEIWAWDQRICLGEVADLATRPDGEGGNCDVAKAEDWPADRSISSAFVQTVLFYEPFRSVYARRGFRIRCARFDETLDLSHGRFEHELWFIYSFFPRRIEAIELQVDSSLLFNGSRVEGHLNGDRLQIGGNLFLSGSARFQTIDLPGARIQGAVSALSSKFGGKFNGARMTIDGDLVISGGAEFQDLFLVSTKIGGNLTAIGSHFKGKISADRLSVGGSIFLRGNSEFQGLRLSSATVGRNLDLRDSTFAGVTDLTGTRVAGDLVLGDSDSFPHWQEGSSLVLRNLSVGTLQDHEQAWNNLDDHLDLVGFSYARIGGLQAVPGHTLADRSPGWMRGWIGKQQSFKAGYFPQPYQHLADTLRKQGFPDKADAMMIYADDHLRDAPTTPLPMKAFLWGERLTIGYGYESWLSLAWLVLLVSLGTWVAGHGGGVLSRADRWQRVWYSVDQLIPLVTLNENHKNLKPAGWRNWYFYVHQIAGFVLASLFVAGLTGFAK